MSFLGWESRASLREYGRYDRDRLREMIESERNNEERLVMHWIAQSAQILKYSVIFHADQY